MKSFFYLCIVALSIIAFSCASAPEPTPTPAPTQEEPQTTMETKQPTEIETTVPPKNTKTEETTTVSDNTPNVRVAQVVDGYYYSAYSNYIDMTGAKTYTVEHKDRLHKIAANFYGAGKGRYFPLIMAATNRKFPNPDLIYPGTKLVIPDLERNTTNSTNKASIKALFNDVADVYDRKGTNVARQTSQRLRNVADSL